MHLEIIARIDSILSEAEVRIAACLACAAARPVLHHRVDASLAPTALRLAVYVIAERCLEAVAICPCHIRRKSRILTHCRIETIPAWLRRKVHLRRKRCCNSHRTILLCSNMTKLLHQFRIKSSHHTHRCRPHGDVSTCTGIVFGICRSTIVPWVCRVVTWDTVSEALYISLGLVVPLDGNLSAANSCEQHMTQIVFCEKLLLLVCEVPRISSALLEPFSVIMPPPCRHRKSLVSAIQHQTGNLLNAQLRGKVGRPVLETSSPVLVNIEAAIPVQVLEGVPVHCQDIDSRLLRISQSLSSLLGDEDISVLLGFSPLRS